MTATLRTTARRRRPAPDPWAMAALTVLAEHYAEIHGDTAETTAASRTTHRRPDRLVTRRAGPSAPHASAA